ncbi:MAG: 16S rRNA (guanine(527)-N(7))-methyltransferase RsmG [Pseudomonadota bacterium]
MTGSEEAASETLTPEAFRMAADVSRETLARLTAFDHALMDRSQSMNLIGRSTVPDRWRRHYLDSAQLWPLAQKTAIDWLDLGSGAGFPGLVLAAIGAERPGFQMRLVEKSPKKAVFLRDAAARVGGDISVLNIPLGVGDQRPRDARPDVLTARAFAPLPRLFALAESFVGPDTALLLPKGRDVEAELTEASKSWMFDLARHPSCTNPDGVILEIRRLRRG